MVIPVIDQRQAQELLRTIDPELHQHIAIVDNTGQAELPAVGHKWVCGRNVGVARSWNWGRQLVIDNKLDMLWLCSTSMRFQDGGRSLVEQMHKHDGYGLNVLQAGWHLVGLCRPTLEIVGSFDEHFYPAYFEDTDYLYRMGLAGLPSPRENGRSWPFIDVAVNSVGDAVSLRNGRVSVDFQWLQDYYVRKWGGIQGEELYDSPFDTGRRWDWWP
jgi:hypothetical protein